jgi:DNA repair exonuclease SbcCD ATPase subunit
MDIDVFLGLVKDPAKYESMLVNLRAEQKKLQEATELAGKASEILKLRKEVAEEKEKLEKQVAQNKLTSLEELDKLRQQFVKKQAELDEKMGQAQLQMNQAEAVKQECARKEQENKQARERNEALAVALNRRDQELAAKEKEVTERLGKLRSVMT